MLDNILVSQIKKINRTLQLMEKKQISFELAQRQVNQADTLQHLAAQRHDRIPSPQKSSRPTNYHHTP